MKNYSFFEKKECTELHYNYIPPCTETNYGRLDTYPEEYKIAKVGENGIKAIHEHPSAGEGDKWFYDIVKDDNTIERVFSPHQAFYKINQ